MGVCLECYYQPTVAKWVWVYKPEIHIQPVIFAPLPHGRQACCLYISESKWETSAMLEKQWYSQHTEQILLDLLPILCILPLSYCPPRCQHRFLYADKHVHEWNNFTRVCHLRCSSLVHCDNLWIYHTWLCPYVPDVVPRSKPQKGRTDSVTSSTRLPALLLSSYTPIQLRHSPSYIVVTVNG